MSLTMIVLWIVLYISIERKQKRMMNRIQGLEDEIAGLRKMHIKVSQAPPRPAEPETPPTPSPEAFRPTPTVDGPAVIEQTDVEHVFSQPFARTPLDDEPAPPAERMEPEQEEAFMSTGEEKSIASSEPRPVEPEEIEIPSPPPSPWHAKWQSFKATVDWEQFTGVKLFAWLGGLALFVAAGFFVKFSIDRNLIPPALRLAISALTGIGLIIAAGRFSERKYSVMRHTLAAGGIGVLYSVVFAATLYYEYLTKPMGFGLLAILTASAFVLAVFYKSMAVSVLGALGAYSTPILVSTGQGNLLMLFVYLAIVNAGLYQVSRRLVSQGLLLVAAAGAVATLGLATWHVFEQTEGVVIAAAWILNLTLFVLFLWHSNNDPKQNGPARQTGILTFLSALAVAIALLSKPGYPCLLTVTATLVAAMCLAWRNRGWYEQVIPCAAVSFLITLTWVIYVFDPTQFSIGFLLLLLYGVFGGLGPLVLIRRYGLDRRTFLWLRVFPVAIVFFCTAVVFRYPIVSFWLWPLLFILELIGIGINLVFRAFFQIGLLLLIIAAGALQWLFHVPAEMLGIGFFLFVICAGIVMFAGFFLLVKRLPDAVSFLQLIRDKDEPLTPFSETSEMAQWLGAAPAAGVCALIAASFLVAYPHYPHPGMATLICFLALVLFAISRLGIAIPGVAVLVSAAMAQSVFVLHPVLGPPVFFDALAWSAPLFLLALVAPFLFFPSFERWRRIWNAWAVFEASQAVFILYAGHTFLPAPLSQWTPLALAALKLPSAAILLRRLEDHPERNAILAFHGGVLLFYLSTLPVLVLSHGWIGLTFTFEAAALLWLNRRIEHPGLRWVALVMAPAGLAILAVNLPLLKGAESRALLNSATFSVAAAFMAMATAVRHAAYPRRSLNKIDLPNYFLWLTVATGFFLVNLIVADLFAQPGARFAVWPERNFLHWACYALSWVGIGGLMWRMRRLPGRLRSVGLIMLIAGAFCMIVLPIFLPEAVGRMRPMFNIGLAVYPLLLVALFYLLRKEPWNDSRNTVKNLFLTLFLVAGFIALKMQSSIHYATGYSFALFLSYTPEKAAASAAGWMIYGLGLLLWPGRMDRPFRKAGLVLMIIGFIKALALPFSFRVAFAQMTPLANRPTMVYLFCLACLFFLTVRKWDERWPLPIIPPRAFWFNGLIVFAFAVLNIEIASVFAVEGRPFGMMPRGSLAMQLAYSIGWLLFAIGLLLVGIRWNEVRVRWAAIVAIVLTACKIFILDVSSLGQLYRVASLLGLAVVLILVSFLYQFFLSEGKKDAQ